MSVDDMEKYYEDDNFLYLVVEVIDLHFGFDLSTVNVYEIAVKIVTQSYSVIGIDGKNVDDHCWMESFACTTYMD